MNDLQAGEAILLALAALMVMAVFVGMIFASLSVARGGPRDRSDD
jgi:hypothetical protein